MVFTKKQKQNRKIILGIVLIVGAIILINFLGGGGKFFAVAGTPVTEMFVKPSWASLECAKEPAKTTGIVKYLDQEWAPKTGLFSCDYFTEECYVKIINEDTRTLGIRSEGYYRKCDVLGNNCGNKLSYTIQKGGTQTLSSLEKGKSYLFDTGGFNSILKTGATNKARTKIILDYNNWNLMRNVGGSMTLVRSGTCDLSNAEKSKIREGEYVNRLFMVGAEGQRWVNYVDDWFFGPPTNVFTHSQYGQVYCTNGRIYDIVELTMADGQLKKLDPTYEKDLVDGTRLKGLGTELGRVDCCPNEPTCTKNFEFEPVIPSGGTGQSCFSDSQCRNAGGFIPISGTQYIKERCQNNVCVAQSPVTVQCTSSAFCGTGQICDLSSTNYGVCKQASVGADICGDGICSELSGESSTTCPSDCGVGGGGGDCISEGQTIVKDQECCAGLEKKKTGFFLFRFLKSEGTCVKTLPKCADCDAFAQNKILGGIFEKKQCEPQLIALPPQTNVTCALSFVKLFLVPIIFLFELLFTPAMIGRYFRRGKGFAWLIGLILAGIVAYVFYTSWVIGVVFIGILLFFQITAGVISLFKKR